MYNFKHSNCTGNGHQSYAADEPYKFTFMAHPHIQARITIEDGYDRVRSFDCSDQGLMEDISGECAFIDNECTDT